MLARKAEAIQRPNKLPQKRIGNSISSVTEDYIQYSSYTFLYSIQNLKIKTAKGGGNPETFQLHSPFVQRKETVLSVKKNKRRTCETTPWNTTGHRHSTGDHTTHNGNISITYRPCTLTKLVSRLDNTPKPYYRNQKVVCFSKSLRRSMPPTHLRLPEFLDRKAIS